MLINPPTWTQNGTYTAEQDRRLVGALVRTEGVVNISSMVPKVISGSRQVSISDGGAYIHGDYAQAGGGGTYFVYNDGAHEVAIPVAGTLDRYDLIVLRIYDSAVSGSVNEARFDVVSGTPAASPRIPAVPRSSIPIAAVKVNAGATQLWIASLTDQRVIAQMNGTVTGNVPNVQQTKLNQLASPSNPILITPESSPADLQISTGGGFQSVGSSQVYYAYSDFPKSASEGTIATATGTGRTYQMRDSRWKVMSGWGPHIVAGRTADVSYSGPYIGGLLINTGNTTGWNDEVPTSSSDYSTYFSLVKGTTGTNLARAGGITFRRPGMYHVEYMYHVVGVRSGSTQVRGRLTGPGISQFSAADRQYNSSTVAKGEEKIVSTSGTISVTNTNKTTHGKIVPWLSASAPLTLSTVILKVELQYEF